MPRRIALALLLFPLAALAGDNDLAKELPRLKPTEPDKALATFQLHKGFHLLQAAVEPVVTDPVSVCFDADGRLYVVEMRGYPYPEDVPSGNVRRLEDRDGDGVFETSTIFVDGLSWPTGVVPYDGGVFIAVAPDILYAKDTNGDGKADVKKVMFRGFGTQNVQALVNGLLWGTDGWIYGASGGNGGDIQNMTHPDRKPVSVRGRDFRFKPDGSAFEAISGGGQFGHTFDNWGHRFVCNNSNHIRQIVLPSRYLERNRALAAPSPVVDIPVEGGAGPVYRISPAEPWRIVRTRQRAADPDFVKRAPKTELVATGFFTSATGVTIYRGTAFPEEYRGNAFIGDVGGNLVHRKLVEKDGPIFKAVRADEKVEFLASTDNWFRPVNFANTPDGTLLILDMYRETIEHPFSIPEPIKMHLDLTSGHDRGRLYHLVPDGFQRRSKPALSNASTAELVSLLADRDAWWRETAQRLLIERNDPAATALLRELARSRPNALGRVHALWTLDALGTLTFEDVAPALTDSDANVREQAARLVEPFARTNQEQAKPLLALAGDPDAMVRFQAAFSIGEVPGPKAVEALASLASRDAGSRWIRVAVLSSIAGRLTEFVEALAKTGHLDQPEGRTWLADLAELAGAGNKPEEIAPLLARFAGPGADPATTRVVVLGLGRGLQRSGGSLRALVKGPASATLAPLFETAAATAADESRTPASRIEAIRLLGLGPVEPALEVLPELLNPRQPVDVQLAALQTLATVDDSRVGPAITARWKVMGPSVRREAAEALLARTDRAAALLDALASKAVPLADLEPARRQQLIQNPNKSIRERASKLLGDQARSDRAPVIAAYRRVLDLGGQPDRGREVFRKVCATCHKAEDHGTDVGPNLATTTNRTPEDLMVHILDPNREVAPTYLNYTIATTDGRVLTGIIADESATAVTLKRAEGASDIVPRDRIDEMASTGLSLMPEGLEKDISPEAMADLLAYLRSLRGDAPAASPK